MERGSDALGIDFLMLLRPSTLAPVARPPPRAAFNLPTRRLLKLRKHTGNLPHGNSEGIVSFGLIDA
jgi:hypothetical protein